MTPQASIRLPALALLVVVCGTVVAVPVGAQVDDGDADGSLITAAWRGSALTRGADGRLCLVRGPDGSLRGEVAVGNATTLDDLLDRRGDGWTIVLAASGDGTLNAWDREWTRLREDAVAALRLVGEALVAEADREPAGASARVRARRTERHVLPATGAPVGLRAELARRGRGRGGVRESLILTRTRDAEGNPALAVRSSRRPGSLRCADLQARRVRFPATETFVPLWPLRTLLRFSKENPGTSAPGSG